MSPCMKMYSQKVERTWKLRNQRRKVFQKEASIIFVKSEVRVGGNKIVFIGYFRSRNLYSDLIHLNEMVGVTRRGIFSSSG